MFHSPLFRRHLRPAGSHSGQLVHSATKDLFETGQVSFVFRCEHAQRDKKGLFIQFCDLQSSTEQYFVNVVVFLLEGVRRFDNEQCGWSGLGQCG